MHIKSSILHIAMNGIVTELISMADKVYHMEEKQTTVWY